MKSRYVIGVLVALVMMCIYGETPDQMITILKNITGANIAASSGYGRGETGFKAMTARLETLIRNCQNSAPADVTEVNKIFDILQSISQIQIPSGTYGRGESGYKKMLAELKTSFEECLTKARKAAADRETERKAKEEAVRKTEIERKSAAAEAIKMQQEELATARQIERERAAVLAKERQERADKEAETARLAKERQERAKKNWKAGIQKALTEVKLKKAQEKARRAQEAITQAKEQAARLEAEKQAQLAIKEQEQATIEDNAAKKEAENTAKAAEEALKQEVNAIKRAIADYKLDAEYRLKRVEPSKRERTDVISQLVRDIELDAVDIEKQIDSLKKLLAANSGNRAIIDAIAQAQETLASVKAQHQTAVTQKEKEETAQKEKDEKDRAELAKRLEQELAAAKDKQEKEKLAEEKRQLEEADQKVLTQIKALVKEAQDLVQGLPTSGDAEQITPVIRTVSQLQEKAYELYHTLKLPKADQALQAVVPFEKLMTEALSRQKALEKIQQQQKEQEDQKTLNELTKIYEEAKELKDKLISLAKSMNEAELRSTNNGNLYYDKFLELLEIYNDKRFTLKSQQESAEQTSLFSSSALEALNSLKKIAFEKSGR